MLPFCSLFLCPSGTFVHCAQTAKDIEAIFFAYGSPVYLFQIVLKFGLYRSRPSSPNFSPKWLTLLTWVSETLRPNGPSDIAQWSRIRAYRKPPSLPLTISPSPKIWVQMHLQGPTFCSALHRYYRILLRSALTLLWPRDCSGPFRYYSRPFYHRVRVGGCLFCFD